mmetsp:Transcript_13303/g.31732  ORF Transcript_13303/g.31732 Transcript_13303/m.31732 type:complete len:233 (-) Transcript_13303:471-1169(-)
MVYQHVGLLEMWKMTALIDEGQTRRPCVWLKRFQDVMCTLWRQDLVVGPPHQLDIAVDPTEFGLNSESAALLEGQRSVLPSPPQRVQPAHTHRISRRQSLLVVVCQLVCELSQWHTAEDPDAQPANDVRQRRQRTQTLHCRLWCDQQQLIHTFGVFSGNVQRYRTAKTASHKHRPLTNNLSPKLIEHEPLRLGAEVTAAVQLPEPPAMDINNPAPDTRLSQKRDKPTELQDR